MRERGPFAQNFKVLKNGSLPWNTGSVLSEDWLHPFGPWLDCLRRFQEGRITLPEAIFILYAF